MDMELEELLFAKKKKELEELCLVKPFRSPSLKDHCMRVCRKNVTQASLPLKAKASDSR
jgi:hypothetical protein